jgi:hypothetical protein
MLWILWQEGSSGGRASAEIGDSASTKKCHRAKGCCAPHAEFDNSECTCDKACGNTDTDTDTTPTASSDEPSDGSSFKPCVGNYTGADFGN